MTVQKRGHVRIPRSEFSGKWWAEKRVFSKWEAWLDMYQLAQHEAREFTSTKFGTIRLERGEFVLSLRKMADRWNWGLKSVRNLVNSQPFLARLRAQRETQAGTIYLIVNYDDGDSGKEEGAQPPAQQRAHEGHTRGTRTSTKALTTTTLTASGEAGLEGLPKSNGRKPKAPPKYPDYAPPDRQRLHKEWSMTKGPIAFSRYVAATGPCFPAYTVDQVSAAQGLAIVEAKQSHALRFLTPETFAQNIVDYVERAEQEPVKDGWFSDWTPQDAGLRKSN